MHFARILLLTVPLLVADHALAADGAASGATAPADRPASIRFADLGNIRDWRADGDALLVQARGGQWYRATFFGPCTEVRFTSTIAFVTIPTGELDRFSSIIADGHRCYFRSFEKTTAPAADALESPPAAMGTDD